MKAWRVNSMNPFYQDVARRFSCLRCLVVFLLLLSFAFPSSAQINTERVMLMGRNALFYDDYVLSIQRFSLVINAKPYWHEPYFYRGLAKFYLEDFAGAEQDCSQSLQLNPYVANTYQLRGLCRVHLKHFDEAIADYRKVLSLEPKSRPSWHNLVLCYFERKQYAEADSALDQMIRYWPREAENLTLKAQVSLARTDTVQALVLIDSALVLDAFDAQAWTMRSMISLQRGEYAQAESEINKAILQRPRVAGNLINRALARFHQNNLRGAMDDYDLALEIQPNNYLAHFNRGLLRAQVGDDNRAIEDFNFVLSVEPDNMIAIYNRALLLEQTGDLTGAIRDISAVIDEYPEFWAGYHQRAQVRRKMGDVQGAERDEFRIMKARMEAKTGARRSSAKKTRKQSQHNIDDYASLVEADTDEPEREYESAYRGRVQDRRVELQPMPLYVLTHHRVQSPLSRYIPFLPALEALNSDETIAPVYLSNQEQPLDSAALQVHFRNVGRLTSLLAGPAPTARLYFARALACYQIRDYEAAVSDLQRAIAMEPDEALWHFVLAQVLCRQHEAANDGADVLSVNAQLGFRRALDALLRATELDPKLTYAWYDMGNVHMVLHEYPEARRAYSQALNLDPRFPDAYYNRGLAYLLEGQYQYGLSDLSQAGEYGIYGAYNLIKRYSKLVK